MDWRSLIYAVAGVVLGISGTLTVHTPQPSRLMTWEEHTLLARLSKLESALEDCKEHIRQNER